MALSFWVRKPRPTKKSPPLFSLPKAERVPQTSATMGLQIKGYEFSLENEQIKTSSVLAHSHILVPPPWTDSPNSTPPSECDSPPPSLPTSPYLFFRKRLKVCGFTARAGKRMGKTIQTGNFFLLPARPHPEVPASPLSRSCAGGGDPAPPLPTRLSLFQISRCPRSCSLCSALPKR